jgi:hypothetical protein
MPRSYWLDLFTYETWTQFLAAGATVSGFRKIRLNVLRQMQPGDVLLCYLTGISRWIGLVEVTGKAYQEDTPIWSVDSFPARIPVKLLAKLEPLTAVPIIEMKDRLSIFQNLKNPHAWTGRVRGSPAKWKAEDGEAVFAAVEDALAHPVERPFDATKLKKLPPIFAAAKGETFTIPEDAEVANGSGESVDSVTPEASAVDGGQKEESAHTEIQWLLLKLGNDMGLDVWVAKNDRGRSFSGHAFTSLSHLKAKLPNQFDPVTNRTIELIDVLWLKGNAIQAAFEIESTTSIFSGLLRMADLITMQPNLSIPLYIVAPAERREKVIDEINRPTFAKLSQPMAEICRFISFEELRTRLQSAQSFIQFLKPEFLDSFSESCHLEHV